MKEKPRCTIEIYDDEIRVTPGIPGDLVEEFHKLREKRGFNRMVSRGASFSFCTGDKANSIQKEKL